MRVLSTAIQNLLASGVQVEPVTIIEVFFGDTPLTFTDRDRILEVGPLDESQRSDSTGMVGSMSILLDDRDGLLKGLFDSQDIHKKKVNVYQSFVGTEDRFLLFTGQISTPIVWDEGKRTFSFDIVSRLEDLEMGWSAEMGSYTEVPQELLGQAWPMIFGTVHHSPCIRLQNIPTAFTTDPFGINDRTIGTTIADLQNLLQLAISATIYYSLKAAEDIPWAAIGTAQDAVLNDPDVKKYVQMQNDILDEITQAKLDQAWQAPYSAGSVGLIPTVFVTQPYSGPFRIGNSIFDGTLNKDGGDITTAPVLLPGSPAGPDLREGFQFFSAGTQAVIAGDYPLRYVASVTPGTVLKVWAMRSFNGIRQMAEVPRGYYHLEAHAIGKGMTATYVVLSQPLSTRAMVENMNTQTWENSFGKSLPAHIVNQIDWEDDIYVSFKSDMGSNPVDILEWAITNFSQNGFDAASFDAARDSMLPMNFTVASNPQLMSFVADVAYQAKSLIYLNEDVFQLLYLPKKGDPVDEINEDVVFAGSLKVSCTPTEDLVTKYVASFRPDYSPFFDEPVKLVTRYNIPKYGVHGEEHDFYCYNNYATVQSASTFWIIRKSQSYKILSARLFLTKLNLEVFDYVTLNFSTPVVSTGPVTGLITKCQYDSENKYVDVEIWCPVLLGEMAESKFAWPAGANTQVEWPQFHEQAGGGGGSLSSPELPPSNPRTEPAGTGDPFRASTPLTRPLDWGASYPEVEVLLADMPHSKAFPWTPKASPNPTRDYKYKKKPDPEIVPKEGMIPGIVGKKVDGDHYMVNVFENGMDKPPRPRKIKQLQIDPTDTIPEETWVYVNYRQGIDGDGNTYLDRSMQCPVWLQ